MEEDKGLVERIAEMGSDVFKMTKEDEERDSVLRRMEVLGAFVPLLNIGGPSPSPEDEEGNKKILEIISREYDQGIIKTEEDVKRRQKELEER